MDVVRYYLAICVIIAHLNTLADIELYWPTSSAIGVGAFFTLSGFLVYPHFLKKNSISDYLRARACRILPPYLLVVIFFALILVSVSTLSFSEYFLSLHFWKYLIFNILTLNFLEPTLPGVFCGPEFEMPAVNGSLWTMKVEWMLYFSVVLVAYIHKKLKNRHNLILIIILVTSVIYRIYMNHLYLETGKTIYQILERQFLGQTCYFYSGVLIYFNKDKFLKYKWYIISMALLIILSRNYIPYYTFLLKPFVVSIVVMWVCLVGDWGKNISRHDNVSYDMYLFHFPIIQLGVFMGMKQWPIALMLLYVFGATTLCAILSWNLIGKRFKRLLLRDKTKNVVYNK